MRHSRSSEIKQSAEAAIFIQCKSMSFVGKRRAGSELEILNPDLDVCVLPLPFKFVTHETGCLGFPLRFERLHQAEKHSAVPNRSLDAFPKDCFSSRCVSGPQQSGA